MFSDEELKEIKIKMEFKEIGYNPPTNLVNLKSSTYTVKILDYDKENVHAVDKEGKQHWFLRAYISHTLEDIKAKLNKKE